jgi:RNA polymerase sigma-70 factor (ECF subfamily)
LQSAIAALHAQAKTAADTDWRQIAALYAELARAAPSVVVALNHAVAVAMSEGYAKGLGLIDQLGSSGELARYYLFHAARADLLRRLERWSEAREAYSKALELVTNRVEETYLRRRLTSLPASSGR